MKSLAFVLVFLLIFVIGLITFAGRVVRSTPAPQPAPAQGVVALTGPSIQRVAAAMKLLEDGKAQWLLVSGVNRFTSREDIRSVSHAPGRLFDCCVALGFSAANTIGNARETAAWARNKQITDIIVVTADYHMPRAMLELQGAYPEGRFHPYPIATDEVDARHWWKSGLGARRMVVEYCKYLVIFTRERVLSLGPKDRAPATPKSSAQPAHP